MSNRSVMGRLPRMFCFLLALAWVPLTQHCELEAMGLIAEQCASTDHAVGHSCGGDSCSEVEKGAYKPASADLKVTSPLLLACACAVCAAMAAVIPPVEELPSPTAVEPPGELRPTWQFVQRAAPLARAPSSILA